MNLEKKPVIPFFAPLAKFCSPSHAPETFSFAKENPSEKKPVTLSYAFRYKVL